MTLLRSIIYHLKEKNNHSYLSTHQPNRLTAWAWNSESLVSKSVDIFVSGIIPQITREQSTDFRIYKEKINHGDKRQHHYPDLLKTNSLAFKGIFLVGK